MTVLAAGASAASVGLAQPMPPRRPPMERVESSKQPPTHTSIDGQDVRSTLLAVLEDKRDHVLARPERSA